MARILVAGNAILDRPESRIVLEAKGYVIITCENVQCAISFFLEDPPDILVLEKGFDNGGDLNIVQVAHACLQKTNIPILLVVTDDDMIAGFDWQQLPVFY